MHYQVELTNDNDEDYKADLRVRAIGTWPKNPTEALIESIAKWEWIVKWMENNPGLPPPETGSSECALCRLYIADDCKGCPVKQKTRKTLCHGSPYDKYDDAVGQEAYYTALMQANREVTFLKSLLPK